MNHPILTGEWSTAPRDPKLPGDVLGAIIDGETGKVEITDGEASIEGTRIDLRRAI